MHRICTSGIAVDKFCFVISGCCIPRNGNGISGALAPADDPGRLSKQRAGTGGVYHFGFAFRAFIFPLRDIPAVFVQMPDGQGRAMERADAAKLQLSVAIKIHQDGIAGRNIQNPGNFPVCARHGRRVKQECALLAGNKGSIMPAMADGAVAVVFEHRSFEQREL